MTQLDWTAQVKLKLAILVSFTYLFNRILLFLYRFNDLAKFKHPLKDFIGCERCASLPWHRVLTPVLLQHRCALQQGKPISHSMVHYTKDIDPFFISTLRDCHHTQPSLFHCYPSVYLLRNQLLHPLKIKTLSMHPELILKYCTICHLLQLISLTGHFAYNF